VDNRVLETIALAVLLGVLGQVFAGLSRLPAIVFLLALGVAAGPCGLGLVHPAGLGTGLPLLTEAFVAVILFEGALTLRPRLLADAARAVAPLVTVGAGITLIGALVMVTGPTVIAPILRRVRLTPSLHAVLKSESILVDPVGVITAAVVFECVTAGAGLRGDGSVLAAVLSRVGAGVAVGAAAGFGLAGLFRLAVFRKSRNDQLVNLAALGVALGAYAAAERLRPGGGILAVIVAGLLLAALPIPFREELERFKDNLTVLGVSVLFILLAAGLDVRLLAGAGLGEVAVLAGLVFVVRPAAVLASTAGSRLTWRERAYLSLVAPRGILAAALAGHFASELRERGVPGAGRVELFVFLTVAATVCLQGGWARLLAGFLGVRQRRPGGLLLVGVNEWSLALAGQLRAAGRAVRFLDDNLASAEAAQTAGFEVHPLNACDRRTYERIDLSRIGVLVAMTPNDGVNERACDCAAAWLGRGNVLRVWSRPGRVPESELRRGARRAMPTELSHKEVCRLLRDGQLIAERRTAESAVVAVGAELPLLVVDKEGCRVAVEGESLPAGTAVVALRRSVKAERPAEAA
jgi:NhaP-type Na+/H+ or K+/H+ antiporter